MDKNYERNPEIAKYLKENLWAKYQEVFKKYEIDETLLAQIQVCNAAEFMQIERSPITENGRMEDLQRMFAVVDSEKNLAIMINTQEKGEIPEGELGYYNLENHNFRVSGKTKERIVERLGIGALELEKQDEIIDAIFQNLEDLEELAKFDLALIIEKKLPQLEKIRDQKIDETNEENGIPKENRQRLENKSKSKVSEEEQKKEEVKQANLPEHVVKYCIMAGITVPKAVVDTKASEAADKIDEPMINRNGGSVTIIKVNDYAKQTDKYLVFQDGKLIIPGNRDDKIDKVVGTRMQNSKNGTMIQPLEIDDEEQYFEYTDSQGLVIQEKLEENLKVSIEDLENYKREVQQELEKNSQELYKIEETPFLSDAQKVNLYVQANERFNHNNAQIAKKYNIELSDVQAINLAIDERTQGQIEQETEEDEIDDRGRPKVPGKRYHE